MLKCRPASLSSSNQGFSLRAVFISRQCEGPLGLMAEKCSVGEYWDDLIKICRHCQRVCKTKNPDPRCNSYCVSTNCKAQLGHYYDRLLKRCVRCADVCGRHPAECSQHCQTLPPPVITPVTTPVTTLTPPVTTKKLLVCVTPRVQNSRVPSALDDSTILLYPLLALCMVLLFFSLSLALVVFLRGARAKTPKPRPKDANHNQECAVQPGQEVGLPGCQPGQSFKDFIPNSSHPTDREPSEDSSPTETCVCVHCFPDLKALGQGNERPPSSIYPQTVLHIAQIENGGPLWTEGNLYTSGPEVHEDAVVGYDSLAISRDNWNGQM